MIFHLQAYVCVARRQFYNLMELCKPTNMETFIATIWKPFSGHQGPKQLSVLCLVMVQCACTRTCWHFKFHYFAGDCIAACTDLHSAVRPHHAGQLMYTFSFPLFSPAHDSSLRVEHTLYMSAIALHALHVLS